MHSAVIEVQPIIMLFLIELIRHLFVVPKFNLKWKFSNYSCHQLVISAFSLRSKETSSLHCCIFESHLPIKVTYFFGEFSDATNLLSLPLFCLLVLIPSCVQQCTHLFYCEPFSQYSLLSRSRSINLRIE